MVQHYIPVTEKNWNSWALSLTKYNREKIEIDNWNVKKHTLNHLKNYQPLPLCSFLDTSVEQLIR